jgi:hypothetical protein
MIENLVKIASSLLKVINLLFSSLATIIIKCPSVTNVTLLLSNISIETFTKQCACTYGFIVECIANEVTNFPYS